jgi:hypothetical protein
MGGFSDVEAPAVFLSTLAAAAADVAEAGWAFAPDACGAAGDPSAPAGAAGVG